MERDLCPRCGAYWGCDCRLDALVMPLALDCKHDWTEAIGIDLDLDVASEEAAVLVCRLCGLYAVSASAR